MQVPANTTPVLVLTQNTKRETGRKAQLGNIQAAKAVADIIRTTLGPRAMLKMLLDPMGGIVLTNDGNSILREIDVNHPAAKSMIELSRTQEEEVGDGTTSVIILAGELLAVAEPFFERHMHPTIIVEGYRKALADAIATCDKLAFEIDVNNKEQIGTIIRSCLGTKFASRWMDMMVGLSDEAVRTVRREVNGRVEIDIKRMIRIEKVPGGALEQSRIIRGVMLNKDVTHPKMRRSIEKPRIILLDCPLEYKKGECQTNVEITQEEDFALLLKQEEEYIEKMCQDIIKFKPDLVFTEKGVSDLAQHFFVKANVTVLRRLRKTDNTRLARACGATIVSRPEELNETDVGTGAGLFEIRKIGDEYFTFVEECKDPKACTILLRGASKDVLNEVERNLQDAMGVARNVIMDPRLVPGGGAVEMAVAHALLDNSKAIEGELQYPYRAVGQALEVIPRTLLQNCGSNVIRTLTALRAKHAGGANMTWGVNGNSGELADMKELGVWEPFMVKMQTIKTSIEASCMLLRIDEIVSGMSKKEKGGGTQAPQDSEEQEAFGDARDG